MINNFNFKKINNNLILLTNDLGRYIFLKNDDFKLLVLNKIDKYSKLYEELHGRLFIVEPNDIGSEEITIALRGMKNYLFQSTSLHIFVLTNRCNLKCVYCQAQDHKALERGIMSRETAQRAIDIALQSPNSKLSFEFQGGEPLINFPIIKFMVEYAEAHKKDKHIDYNLVSNFSLMTDEIADFLIRNNISVCTSLDGPEWLHCQNRRAIGKGNSYKLMREGLAKLRKRGFKPGAIQTTTRHSLEAAKEIVREYVEQGMNSIFLRPLTPLGFAKTDWEQIGYTPEEFLKFYKVAFEEILQVNREGIWFAEQHAAIFLRKLLIGESENYMELRSPCGAGLGQLAYYYDGDIYTCDEARMVAEAGNLAFRLGNVYDNTYTELITSNVCKATCSASILETIPGCCDCVYQPYCGVCPVINLATYGDIFASKSGDYRCTIYKGILDFLFEKLKDQNSTDVKIMKSWIGVLEDEK